MKTLMILSLMTISTLAQASYFQVDCGSANGAVRTGEGHDENFVQITERNWETGETKVIRDEERALEVQNLSSQELSREDGQTECVDGGRGVWTNSVRADKVRITKADGSLFSEKTLYVTPDRKAVEVYLVCEAKVSGYGPCEN